MGRAETCVGDEKLTAFLELELIVHNAISCQRQVSLYIKIRRRLTKFAKASIDTLCHRLAKSRSRYVR